jgi:hypothetical protein
LSFAAEDPAQTAVVLGADVRLTPSPGGGDADVDMPLLESGYSRA